MKKKMYCLSIFILCICFCCKVNDDVKKQPMIQVGLAGDEITLPYDQIVRKEICVQGSFGHRWHNWEMGLKLLSEHQRM